MAQLKITLVKSVIGSSERQRNVVKALGLKKTNSSVVQEDTPTIRGMVNKVSHLVSVEEV
ncbi:MAG: 50S ribosomal protein L30 [Peptococcaceae bacterium]|nr:50S ribosomal protein L30 [Peptococcaceae bacterium]